MDLPAGRNSGEQAVQMDSRNNRMLVRPAVNLYFASLERLPGLPDVRDAVYRDILHVPIDDPYLGLADILIPGTN